MSHMYESPGCCRWAYVGQRTRGFCFSVLQPLQLFSLHQIQPDKGKYLSISQKASLSQLQRQNIFILSKSVQNHYVSRHVGFSFVLSFLGSKQTRHEQTSRGTPFYAGTNAESRLFQGWITTGITHKCHLPYWEKLCLRSWAQEQGWHLAFLLNINLSRSGVSVRFRFRAEKAILFNCFVKIIILLIILCWMFTFYVLLSYNKKLPKLEISRSSPYSGSGWKYPDR